MSSTNLKSTNNSYTLNLNRLKSDGYSKKYSEETSTKKNAKKFPQSGNISKIFSTESASTKYTSRKTYYNNDNYKKFFTKNISDF